MGLTCEQCHKYPVGVVVPVVRYGAIERYKSLCLVCWMRNHGKDIRAREIEESYERMLNADNRQGS